jgi:hypothetical protein
MEPDKWVPRCQEKNKIEKKRERRGDAGCSAGPLLGRAWPIVGARWAANWADSVWFVSAA